MILKPDLDARLCRSVQRQPMMIVFCDIVEPSTGELVCPRPALDRQARRSLSQIDRHRRHDLCRPRSRILHVRRCPLRGRLCRFGLRHRRRGTADQHRQGIRERQHGATVRAPRAATSRWRRSTARMDIRGEMVSTMIEMGLPMDKHHHEVAAAPARAGHHLRHADRNRRPACRSTSMSCSRSPIYGKTATFMPKPIKDDNGSGMHTHMSIWKDGKPTFAGNGYAGLSGNCLYYIGGVIKHAKALNAFTNPTTNSYKRLVPGFEAPVLLAYSARNRSAACRIPLWCGRQGQARRVPLPRCDGQPLPRLFGAAHGGPRRDREQDPSGRSHGQEPLRSAGAIRAPFFHAQSKGGSFAQHRHTKWFNRGRYRSFLFVQLGSNVTICATWGARVCEIFLEGPSS